MKCPPNRAPESYTRVPANVVEPGFYQAQAIVQPPSLNKRGGFAGIEGTEPARMTQLYQIGTMDATYRDRNPTKKPIDMYDYRGKGISFTKGFPLKALDPSNAICYDAPMRDGYDPDFRFSPNVDYSQSPLWIESFR